MPQKARRNGVHSAVVLDHGARRRPGEGAPTLEVTHLGGVPFERKPALHDPPRLLGGEQRELVGIEHALRPVLPGDGEDEASRAEEDRGVEAQHLVHDEVEGAHAEAGGQGNRGFREGAVGSVVGPGTVGGLPLRFDTRG